MYIFICKYIVNITLIIIIIIINILKYLSEYIIEVIDDTSYNYH